MEDDYPVATGREASGTQHRDLCCSQDHTGGSKINRFSPSRPLCPLLWRNSRLSGGWGGWERWLRRPTKWSEAGEALAFFWATVKTQKHWRPSCTAVNYTFAVWDGQPTVVRHIGPTVVRQGCCCMVANCAPPVSYRYLSLGGAQTPPQATIHAH